MNVLTSSMLSGTSADSVSFPSKALQNMASLFSPAYFSQSKILNTQQWQLYLLVPWYFIGNLHVFYQELLVLSGI